jgi:eukaryotic-like serine/threonine-protein kinase
MDDAARVTRCSRCGAEWLADTPEGLCPACLLAGATGPTSELTGDEMTTLSPRGVASGAVQAGPWLVPGQVFGPYRIGRLLGRGGMGEVYEAEHVEQGRRVALKTLNQRLAGAQDRARFLREGQLAASISHPNSVYIFGSEEIAGTPVIAMELLAGGTLKDRVKDEGPLPPAEAVDAILQVIAGLEAAHAGGVLHRDIKPANCFTDRDGTVKIGDFGLSISTLARDVTQLTMSGTFQGTPQFASPEQIRGEPLDVRADIYSVGATLYCLLTGRPPFDDKELLTLVTRIGTEVPQSPRTVRPCVPSALAAVTLSCLAKDRAARLPTYAELTDRLRPFSSTAPTPATLGRRVLANIVDRQIITLASVMPVNVYLLASGAVSPGAQRWLDALQLTALVAYYTVLEGYWSASIGKRLCRLRVIGRDGQPPGLSRALARTLLFELSAAGLLFLPALEDRLVGQPGFGATLLSLASYVVLRGLLFSTARRRNGFAGVHELVSGTRVVERVRETARAVLDERLEAKPARTSPPRIGPYDIVGTLGATDVGELLVGFDTVLRRRVWVHALVPGAPPVAPLVRDLSRPGRLRWLGGRRREAENWDAYEALDGLPFAPVIRVSQPWRRVKHWLQDLAREIDSGLPDGSLPSLTLDRIWITGEGRARLLDFNTPGSPAGAAAAPAVSVPDAQDFLAAVATRALGSDASAASPFPGSPHRAVVPLSVSMWIHTLATRGFTSFQDVVGSITSLMSRPDTVTRWRRAASIAPCAAGPAVCAVIAALTITLAQQAITPDVAVLSVSLRELMSLPSQRVGDAARYRSALEVSIADRVAPMVADERAWHSPIVTLSMGRFRRLAEQILADHPHVSPDERAAATSALGSFLERQERAARSPLWTLFPIVVRVQLMLFLTMVAVFGILAPLLFRGGILMRALGIAVVTRTGEELSPLRAAGRGLIAWLPLIALVALLFRINPQRYGLSDSWQQFPLTIVAVAALGMIALGGVLWAVLRPERGLQDRIAGTWLVPR